MTAANSNHPDLGAGRTWGPNGHRDRLNLERNRTQGLTEIGDRLDSEIYRTCGPTKLKDLPKTGDLPDEGTVWTPGPTGLGD